MTEALVCTNINVEFMEMVEINNGATFQCYFCKVGSFDGIFLKSESFQWYGSNFPLI